MKDQIRFLEEIASNGHVALNTMQYDGWLLRFSCGCTGRANSVSVLYPSLKPLEEKVPYCEACYAKQGLPALFKLTDCDTELAAYLEKRGYTVVWVTGTPDPAVRTSATGWRYESGGTDVAFLSALAEAVQRDYHTDETRTCAVGFSNGAFMAHCLAAEAGDSFSAVVSVAGTMDVSVWENRPETCQVSFLQITGEKDAVVPKNSDGSARYARDPAIEDVIAWCADGLSLCETIPIGHGSTLTCYTDDSTRRTVWHLQVKDGRHSWSSERFTGIDTNALILDFLQSA